MRWNLLPFCLPFVAWSCVPETPADCENNAECGVGEACFDGACVKLQGEGEGEGEDGEGEEGEGEGVVAVCGNDVVEVGEDCDNGDVAEDDDFLDGCHGCDVVAPVVEIVAGEGDVDSVPLPRSVVALGDGRTAVIAVDGVYVGADFDRLRRVAGSGSAPRSLLVDRLTDDASGNDLFGAGVLEIDDAVFCNGSIFLASSELHFIFRVVDDEDGVEVFAGNGSANDVLDPPNFSYGNDPLAFGLSPRSLACRDDVLLAATGTEGRVISIATDGVSNVVLGSKQDGGGGTAAQNLFIVEPVAVDVEAGGTLLVALATNNNEKVVRVGVDGSVTTVVGDGANGIDFDAIDDPVAATSVDVFGVSDVVSDGNGGLWVVHFLRDVWHVDAAGTMQRVGRTLPLDLNAPNAALLGVIDGDIVFPGAGSFVRATAAAVRTPIGAPRALPVIASSVDAGGLTVSSFGGVFAVEGNALAPIVDLGALDGFFAFGGVRTGSGVAFIGGLAGTALFFDDGSGAAPEIIDGYNETGIVSIGVSALDDDRVFVATDDCRVFRYDIAAGPIDATPIITGCNFNIGATLATTTLDPTAMIVTPGLSGDVLIFIADNVVVRVPVNAGDGAPAVIAGNRAGGGTSSGDGAAALSAGFADARAIVRRNDGSFVVADGGELRTFTIGGDITSLAGAQELGVRDGPAAQARFKNIVGLAPTSFDDASVLVVEPFGVRLFSSASGRVSTLFGGDAIGADQGRLGRPRHVSCDEVSCVVSDDATHTLRSHSGFGVLRLAGGEGDTFDVVAGLSRRNGELLFSRPDLSRIDTLNAEGAVAAAQGAFVVNPGPLAGVDGDNGILFVSDLTSIKRVGTPTGTLFGGVVGPFNDIDVDGATAAVAYGGNGDVMTFAADSIVDEFDGNFLEVSATARSVAIAGDVIAFIDDDGVHITTIGAPEVVIDVDVGFFASDVDIIDDAVFVVGSNSGALARITLE